MAEQIEATTLIEAVQLFLAELEPELKKLIRRRRRKR